MKVYKVSASGISIPTPRVSRAHSCFYFSHGPTGEGSVGEFRLHLKRNSFWINGDYDWPSMNYQIAHSVGREYDDLGNLIHQLMPSESASGDCICLLDMCPNNGGTATLFSWSKEVTVLGKGIGQCARRFGGARRASEVDYPVLLCRPGARFAWINHGLLFGSPADCEATWDGEIVRVSPRPFMPVLAERLERRLCARQ